MAQVNYRTVSGPVRNIGELRSVGQDNKSVIDFSIAYSTRYLDGDVWKNGETEWIRVTVWRKLAENFKASVREGDRVLVSGQSKVKPGFTGSNGTEYPASSYIEADEIGLSLAWDNAHSDRQQSEKEAAKTAGSSNSSSRQTSSRPAAQASKPAEVAKKPETVSDELDLDFLDDDDDFA